MSLIHLYSRLSACCRSVTPRSRLPTYISSAPAYHTLWRLQSDALLRSRTMVYKETQEQDKTKTSLQVRQSKTYSAVLLLIIEKGHIMTTSAAARVLAIPELLEMILLHLSMPALIDSITATPTIQELFAVQRVNATFRNMIQQSMKLRRVMYLDPLRGHEDGETGLNPVCIRPDTIISPLSLYVHPPTFGPKSPKFYCRARFNINEEHKWEGLLIAERSWRQMKLINDSRPVIVDLRPALNFGIGVYLR